VDIHINISTKESHQAFSIFLPKEGFIFYISTEEGYQAKAHCRYQGLGNPFVAHFSLSFIINKRTNREEKTSDQD